jgi:hypothetical protein
LLFLLSVFVVVTVINVPIMFYIQLF